MTRQKRQNTKAMVKLFFEKQINAPIQKVWDTLWNDESYREWTKHFAPGSNMKSDWEVGGKTMFLDAWGQNGMVSTIKSISPPNDVVFPHLGNFINGREVLEGETVNDFYGSEEAYFLSEENGVTTLKASLDTLPAYEEMMRKGFENGFEEIKKMAEQ